MVMEVPISRPGSSNVVAETSVEALPAEIPWTRIDLDLYEVVCEGRVVGYVEVVGAVFVALDGRRYDRAVEVAQHLTFHSAVDAVLTRAR